MLKFHKDLIPMEDRTWAALAHLSGLAGYLIPLGGVVVPIVFMITRKDDPVIHAIAKQALMLNILCFILGLLVVLLYITVVLLPLGILLSVLVGLMALGLPIVGAVKASQGEYFEYPLVGRYPA